MQLPPLKFTPHLVPKVWGGPRLPKLLNLPPTAGDPIGEAWTICDLPEVQTRVHGGPFNGATLGELCRKYGSQLLGEQFRQAASFPLLAKLLDTSQYLSVQVHPRPRDDDQGDCTSVKHEAWYVLAADEGARVFIGLKPGVTRQQLQDAAGTKRICDLLIERPAKPGDCFYLPSGIVHALGAGVLVAEFQTPPQITYRLYDWDRASREMHLEEGLDNALLDVPENQIVQAATPRATAGLRQRCASPFFELNERVVPAGAALDASEFQPDHQTSLVLAVAAGRARVQSASEAFVLRSGEMLLVPAVTADWSLIAVSDLTLLEVRPRLAASGKTH